MVYGYSAKSSCGCNEEFPDLSYSIRPVHQDEVRELQQILSDMGYYKGQITTMSKKQFIAIAGTQLSMNV
jgi:hypothetical protein